MTSEPKVTGLSPMTGPPGTKITVRGENLGLSNDDIIKLTINGADCLPYLEWKSPKKIIARCTNIIGSGDIVITTESGGVGTCDVQFKCYEKTVGQTDESAVWIDEDFEVADKENPSIPGAAKESSVDISSNRFNPHLYLVQNYPEASIDDLERLQTEMEAKLANKTNPEIYDKASDRIPLMKSNLPVIMECLKTIERLNLAISPRDTSIDNIVSTIESSRSKVQEFFDPLLAQRNLVHSIESAMQQNETLFKLPSAIEESIKTRNYDSVVKEISSVLSRIDSINEEQSLVEKIQKKVTAKIDELKETIRVQLHKDCTSTDGRNLDEIKKLISHLQRLGDEFDVWTIIVEMSDSLNSTLAKRSKHYLKLSLEHERKNSSDQHTSGKSPSHDNELPHVIKFVQSAIHLFENTYYDILNMGRSYFDPKDEFACEESDNVRQSRIAQFEDMMISRTISYLCQLLRSAIVPESPKLEEPSPWPLVSSRSYVNSLRETLDSVISCHIHLTKVNLPLPARVPVDDFKELVTELRIESMKRLFEDATRLNKDLYRTEDWVIEVDDIHGGCTKLPLKFEKNVLDTLKFAHDVIFKPNLQNEKSILKEVSVQAEMKGLAQSLINSFTECLDNALISSEEHPAESTRALIASEHSNRILSKYMNRLLITICNCQFTKEQIFPKLQDEFEKMEGLKMDSVFKNCTKKYYDYIVKISEKFCRIKCSELTKRLKTSKANDERDLQIDLMIVNSQIFLVAPQLVNSLMTAIVNAMQVELGGVQRL